MKKNVNYLIDFTANAVIFAARFYDEATTNYMSEAAKLIREFRKEGFTVVRETRKAPVKRANSDKEKTLTYKQMRDFLLLLDDHDDMVASFDSLRDAHKHSGDRLKVINEWFRKECPLYGHSTMYEWAEDGKHIVHNPNPVGAEIEAIAKVS